MPAVKLRLAVLVVSFVFGPALVWKGPLWKTVITFGTAAIASLFWLRRSTLYQMVKFVVDANTGQAWHAAYDHAFMRPTAIGAIIVTTATGASRLRLR